MAHYYTEFSEVIPNLTDEEKDWLANQLRVFKVYGNKGYPEDQVPDSLAAVAKPDWYGCRAYRDMDDYDPDWGPEPHFDYEFGHSDEHGKYVWIGSAENGRPDCVTHLVQKFLRRFRPGDSWALRYSVRCSKQRVGEFGGGAKFVTADNIARITAHEFVERQQEALAQSQGDAVQAPLTMVITVADGMVDGAYSTAEDAEVVLVDWDTEDNVLGDPGILEVETRCGHLELVNVEVRKVHPLNKLLCTNDAAALNQAGIKLPSQ